MKLSMMKYKDIWGMLVLMSIYIIAIWYKFDVVPTIMETSSVFLVVIATALMRRQMVSGLTVGIISNVISIVYFSSLGLYGQAAQRLVVIGFRSRSIATWKTRKDGTVLKPSTMTWKWQLILMGILTVIVLCASYYGFITAIDWLSASMIIAFNILMIWKKIEGWMVFLVANAIATTLFFLSGSYLWMFNGLFAFGTGIAAIKGWMKDAKNSNIKVQMVDN